MNALLLAAAPLKRERVWVLHALIEAMPLYAGAWTADERARWLAAMVAALDYAIEVREQ